MRPIEVAVIGGGCASLTAAFELTRPEHNGRYSVTVYQMGWRLGGKGASGRGIADRVEEHGLHLWMGFYENAFRIMRECYAELPPRTSRRFVSWQDAFSPARDVAVADTDGDDWSFWVAHFPPGRGLPGDPLDSNTPFSVTGYLRQSAMLVAELLRSAESQANDDGRAARALRYGQVAAVAAVFEASESLVQAMSAWLPQSDLNPLLRLVDAIAATAKRMLEDMVADDIGLRRVWQVIDIILASMRGAMIHRLALDPRGFDALNDCDWREWLRMNGASQQSLDSGFMRAIYDLCFAFEDGDVSRPRLAAGVAMRGAVRMFFTYRGSLFWRMNAGMGDVVFAPLYEVLRARGVRFEFFHRLRNIRLHPTDDSVDALVFDVQARTKDGAEYQPLVDVHGVSSWPAVPDYNQLQNGEILKEQGAAFEMHWDDTNVARKTLKVTRDFDMVVLGVSVGVLPFVAGELIDRSARWRDMVRHVKSVPTQALQLWLREDVHALGWPHPPVNLSGFVEPFDTWADMGHLIPEESWSKPVKAIAYFCSVLPDVPVDITRNDWLAQRAAVRRNAAGFLSKDLSKLWPGCVNERGFRWDLLASEGSTRSTGARRLDSQYWTANVNPTDRYVLSLPGSIRYRVSPLDPTFDNLTIAGDWTATGLDSGCIESAMISGRLAAHAVSTLPPLADIAGYDHP